MIGNLTSALLKNPFAAIGQLGWGQLRFRYQYTRNRTRVRRDMLRRPALAEFEVKRMVYKALHRDQRLPMQSRLKAMITLHNFHPYTRHTEIKPRCVMSGRGTGVFTGFRVNRMIFRESAINGRLPGAIVAKW